MPTEPVNLRTTTKYMTFVLSNCKPKTTCWLVLNNKSGNTLGDIQYYPSWRQYVFMPEGNTVFNNDCLRDIAKFLDDLNHEQRQQRQQRQQRVEIKQ